MTYPAYKKYKPSGVPWLGDVPEGWEVKPLKHLVRYNSESLPETTDPDLGIKYVDISSVNLIEGITNIEDFEFEKAPSRARRIVRDGDTIVSTVRTYLKAIAAIRNPEKNLIVSTGFAVIRPEQIINPDYLGYYLQSEGFIGEVVSKSVGVSYPAINASDLVGIEGLLPLPAEQKAIADFLDKKTAEIDALVAKKQELLALLAEQRTALITHAVTKGLNAKAPMKDSGIDWLGHIPQHWEVKRLKFAVRLVNDKVEASSVDLAYMGLEQIESWTGKRIPNEEAISEGVVNVFKPNDVLFGKLRPYLAKVYLAVEEATCSTEAFVMRPAKQLLPDFLQLYMLTDKFINAVDATTYGAKMPRANWESVGNLMMLLPPLEEQKAIVSHIRKNVGRIEAVSSNVQEVIDRLKEYRTALITNAVTGKIKVV